MSFSANLAMADAAIASYFDEDAFQIVPAKTGPGGVNGALIADLVREPFDFMGTLEFGPPPMQGSAQYPRGMAAMPPGGSGVSHQAVITALSTSWPYRPKKDDRIMHAGQTYVVATVMQDGTDRIAIFLGKARAA